MADWFLAPTLAQFRKEVNTLYPKRDKTSDGTIGNASHAGGTSDHNPDVRGCVCAIDIDEDVLGPTDVYPSFHGGSPARHLVDTIVSRAKAGLLPQVYYVIYEKKIMSRTYGFTPRDYTGSNPHNHHFHLSVYHKPELADSTKPWGLAATGEYPKPTSDDVWLSKLTFGQTASDSVWQLQNALNKLIASGEVEGPPVPLTGNFGRQTAETYARALFQAANVSVDIHNDL